MNNNSPACKLFVLAVLAVGLSATVDSTRADEPPAIGSRRELFVDHFLIDKLDNARLKLHEPRSEGAVLHLDKPWEGPFCAYTTVIKDGDRYRMYYRGATPEYNTSSYVERLTMRLDGFVSVNAPHTGGELLTRPFTFEGGVLSINFSTSAAGGIRIELQDAAGEPIPGYTLADCAPIVGDEIDRRIAWQGGGDLATLASRPIRLRVVMRDADLYAIQFFKEPR